MQPNGELSLSLYELETGLVEAVVAAEETGDDSLREVVAAYMGAAIEKRDRIARFLHFLEAQEDLAANEIKRLQERKTRIVNAQRRIKESVVRTMEILGVKKLEGETSTFSLRQNPSSVQILDLDAVPAEFVTVKTEVVPDKKRIGEALKSGREVPGADLRFGDMGVQVR